MTCYNVVSIFDYNYTLASIVGLCFYGLLPVTDLRGTNTVGLGSHTLVMYLPYPPCSSTTSSLLMYMG
jgi:hypothetical protein